MLENTVEKVITDLLEAPAQKPPASSLRGAGVFTIEWRWEN